VSELFKFDSVFSPLLPKEKLNEILVEPRVIQHLGASIEELPIYVGVLSNYACAQLGMASAFDLADPNHASIHKLLKRKLDELVAASLDVSQQQARRLLNARLRLHLANGQGSDSVLWEKLDGTILTRRRQQLRSFYHNDTIAKEAGITVERIACASEANVAVRLRRVVKATARAVGTSRAWEPPEAGYHYQDETIVSVHAVSGGGFETNRRKF
jgi:hypothetical protein